LTTHRYNKKDLKSTDAVTQELKKGFQWSRQHSTLVGGLATAIVLFGIAYSIAQYFSDQAENKAQEAFYKVNNEYAKTKTHKEDLDPEEAAVAEKAKNMPADEDAIAQKFSGIMKDYPRSRAALLAFLDYSDIETRKHKDEEISKAAGQLNIGSDLLSSLVLVEKGHAEANVKNCKQAIETWNQVLAIKSAQSIYPEVHLYQALCFESLNDNAKATDNYNKVLAEAKDSPTAKSAERYLRLMKTKVN
jgi:tetratricopeptide (TPR) repeat protein